MKYVTEYRDAELVGATIREIGRTVTRPWVIMEICGGQTHAIVRHGIDQLLPPQIELVHGPGCPVCVTPLELIDKALDIAARPNVIFTSYGDMLRVPGSGRDLFSVRATGGDVRVVYSPLDAVKIAQANPDKEVVFFAIGFETTAPANAMSVVQARALGLTNYSVLVSHVCVPPAMHAILGSPHNRVQGFLAAGHVNAVMGYWEYPPIAAQYNVPIVVTGFEPLDVAPGHSGRRAPTGSGAARGRERLRPRRHFRGQHPRPAGHRAGLRGARPAVARHRPHPGQRLGLAARVRRVRRRARFDVGGIRPRSRRCASPGKSCKGLKKPHDCAAFGHCTPESPLGRRWSHPKARARPTIAMEDTWRITN
jgi:hydrogenase expression/formation protein HypD